MIWCRVPVKVMHLHNNKRLPILSNWIGQMICCMLDKQCLITFQMYLSGMDRTFDVIRRRMMDRYSQEYVQQKTRCSQCSNTMARGVLLVWHLWTYHHHHGWSMNTFCVVLWKCNTVNQVAILDF